MAFPAVESTATTGRTAAETTSPINFPAVVSPNALIVAVVRATVAGAIGWPVNWVELVEDSSDASDDVMAIAYLVAVGNEDGTTFNVTHGSGKMAAIVYSILGAKAPSSQAPQISTVAVGTSTLPDPTVVTPTGGAKDYLFLWLGGWEGEQTSPPTGNPTNYTNPLGADTAVAGAITTNCRVGSAQRELNASSENPGSWTISVSDDWSAWVMAVHPVTITLQSMSATQVGVATLTRANVYAKTLSAVSVGVATLSRVASYGRALSATALGVATLSKAATFYRTLNAVSIGVATLSRLATYSRTLSATAIGVATLTPALLLSKTLSAVAVGVASLSDVYTAVRALSATTTGVATLSRTYIGMVTLSATALGVATLSKLFTLAKTLSAVAVGVATLATVFIPGGAVAATLVRFINWRPGSRHRIR